MSKFIFKLFVFLLPIPIYFLINMSVNYGIYNYQGVNIDGPTVLIMGDSHSQRSINPELWDNALNVSQSAEPYVATYWKAKKLLENIRPDTIIMGFSYHNLSEYWDLTFSKNNAPREMFRRYYPIHNFKSIRQRIPIDNSYFLKTLWKETAFFPKLDHYNYIGKYEVSTSSDISDWNYYINKYFYENGQYFGVSEFSISYVDSIIDLAQRHEIDIVLSSPPVHKYYLDNVPETFVTEYEILKERYSNSVLIFDKTKERTYADSLFLDSNHLNEYGSTRYTKELINFLKTNVH